MVKTIKQYVRKLVKLIQHKPMTAIITIVEPKNLLKGKVALITGGTSGIGRAIATHFIKAGATVIITSRNENRAKEVAKEISIGANLAVGVCLDISAVDQLQPKIDKIINLVPGHKIDILVNNAGVLGGDIRNTSYEEFDNIITTNLKGTFFLSKIVADHMINNNVEGNILNIASSSSIRPAISAYMLSKWGIRGLTEGLAKMLIPHKIVVNGIAPGPTATPLLQKYDYSDIAHDTIPNGRFALPEEIAAMSLFLAGPQGRSIVGDIVYMTGGAGIIENNDMDYSY